MNRVSIDLMVDDSRIGEFADAVDEGAFLAMRLSVDYVASEAKKKAPNKTGILAASIRAGDVTGRFSDENLTGEIAAFEKYALWVNDGTRPHVIYPNKKKALRFPSPFGPGFAFRKRVKHPGTKAQPFLNADQYTDKVKEIFADAIDLALDR